MMPDEERDFFCESLYGYRTQQPLVQVTLQGTQIQVSPATAVEMAQNLIAAAESALQDGFLVGWVKDVVGAEDKAVAGLLDSFRHYRETAMPWDEE